MVHRSPTTRGVKQPLAWCGYLLLLLTWAGRVSAQSLPNWQLAVGGLNNQPTGVLIATASAVDTQGNVFVTGFFSGSILLGSTQLTTAFPNTITDMFVAKWDVTAQAFTWAASGGGAGSDVGLGIAVSGSNVYVTGDFEAGTGASFAGHSLAGVGGLDIFVVKYVDTSTGHTPTTSSFANGWVTSGGGTGNDFGNAIAVSGANIYVTGSFYSASGASIAGQPLAGAGAADEFVAKYIDTSTGSSPATSSFANGWVTSGGGLAGDSGRGIAVSGTGIFVTGQFTSKTTATIAGQSLTGAGNFAPDIFVAKYLDTSTGSTPATSSVANGWATSSGGTGSDYGIAIAVRGTGVFVTGALDGSDAIVAGQPVPATGRGGFSMFVAKYLDTSTGNTPATSSFANGWATNGGGLGNAIAVSGPNVYVVGTFASASLSGAEATIAGQTLPGAGNVDMFLAKYIDTSTGNTPATSSFQNGGAISGGGAYVDVGYGIVLSGQQVYAVGAITPPATFGSITLTAPSVGQINFISRLRDTSLMPLPAKASSAANLLSVYPNPVLSGVATLSGLRAAQVVNLYDAMGQLLSTSSANASGSVSLPVSGLAAGVYMLRVEHQILRLAVP